MISTLKKSFFSAISGEFMMGCGMGNGGSMIFMRTLWVGTLLNLLRVALVGTFNPNLGWGVVLAEVVKRFSGLNDPSALAIYGAVYLALYARFSSQWTYLANLFNQIKQAEVGMYTALASAGSDGNAMQNMAVAKISLINWKAGFIEDALDLHLAQKPIYSGVIKAWVAENPGIKTAFLDHTPDSQKKWAKIEALIN